MTVNTNSAINNTMLANYKQNTVKPDAGSNILTILPVLMSGITNLFINLGLTVRPFTTSAPIKDTTTLIADDAQSKSKKTKKNRPQLHTLENTSLFTPFIAGKGLEVLVNGQ